MAISIKAQIQRLLKNSFRANGWEIGNAHDTHALAVHNIIDEDIKTFGRVPRKISAGTGYA